MIMAPNKLNASRQRCMLDENEGNHHVTGDLFFLYMSVFCPFVLLVHGGKKPANLIFPLHPVSFVDS